jgi:hypothetical protein
MSQSKIFGIGLARTGTTTLNKALQILGYSAVDFPLGLRGIEEHDAATDVPVADCFEFLDRKYPGSKFIYTIRRRDCWLKSCQAHWARYIDAGREIRPEAAELTKRMYGTIDFDATLFVNAYDNHEKRVLNYFKYRPGDLLIMNICSGESGWEPLCAFLKKEIPDTPFPRVNKTKNLFEYQLEKMKVFEIITASKIWKKIVKKARRVNRVLRHHRWR